MYFNFLFINPKILLILLKKEFPTLYLSHTYYQKIHDKKSIYIQRKSSNRSSTNQHNEHAVRFNAF